MKCLSMYVYEGLIQLLDNRFYVDNKQKYIPINKTKKFNNKRSINIKDDDDIDCFIGLSSQLRPFVFFNVIATPKL